MPIYEYKCTSCHFRFEKKQGFHDKPEAVCPKCQGKAHRVIHPAPVIFKGKGFYITDSRKGGETGKKPEEGKKG
jgi:putative FmdB family regulatory protein